MALLHILSKSDDKLESYLIDTNKVSEFKCKYDIETKVDKKDDNKENIIISNKSSGDIIITYPDGYSTEISEDNENTYRLYEDGEMIIETENVIELEKALIGVKVEEQAQQFA